MFDREPSVRIVKITDVTQGLPLIDFFEGFTVKPDIIIDDMPSTCVTQSVHDVRQEQSWGALAERIIDKHID